MVPVNLIVPEAGVTNSTTDSASVANPATESSDTLLKLIHPAEAFSKWGGGGASQAELEIT